MIAAHLAFVDDPGEAARAGEDAEEGHLGQGDRARAVVHEHDPVAGESELVAAPRRRAVQRRDVALPRMGARVLDGVPGLVGELAEIDLVGMAPTRPSIRMLAPAENTRSRAEVTTTAPTSRVLEAKALDRVVELDIHPEVVRVELELVAGADAALLVHREPENRHRPVDLDSTSGGSGPVESGIPLSCQAP